MEALTPEVREVEHSFSEAFKDAFGFKKRVKYNPKKKQEYLTKILTRSRSLYISPYSYFSVLFGWVKRTRKNPNKVGFGFYGSETAKEIAAKEIKRFGVRYKNVNPHSSIHEFIANEIYHSKTLVSTFDYKGIINKLSPYYLAVITFDPNSVSPRKLADITNAKLYMDKVPGLTEYARGLVT